MPHFILRKLPQSVIYAASFPFLFWMMVTIQHDVLAGARYMNSPASDAMVYMNSHSLFPLLHSIGSIFHMNEFRVLLIFPIVLIGGVVFLITNKFLVRFESYQSVFRIHIMQSIFYYALSGTIMLLWMFQWHGLFLDTAIAISVWAIFVNAMFLWYRNKKSNRISLNA